MATDPKEEKKGDGTYGEIKDTSLRIKTPDSFPELLRIDMNPRVSIISFIVIWGFIAWCMFDDEADEHMLEARGWVTDNFTWFYVGSQDIWSLFLIVVYFSRYGTLKLGKDDDEPDYPTITWFTMLFACGIGVGLFYYGVSEPIWHYTSDNRYYADPYRPDNLLAQDAMNLTLFHWGIHGWIVYSLIGLLLGIMVYRHGLPMKMSSCFYPLMGDKIFGWMGDFIDGLSIITTLFGVCTSLGLGVMQLNAGLHILNNDIPIEDYVRVLIIWCITLVATASTLSGMDIGIRRLSELCFTLGMFLMTFLTLLEEPVYLLNVFCQSIGYYFQYIIQLGFHCDAFEMHSRVAMGTERNRIEDTGTDAYASWMDDWTIFYWGWWIAWSPFVGIFIAKISKGRTVREFINGTMTAPILYTFAWFAVFGGAAIAMEREAALKGYCCEHDFLNATMIDANDATLATSGAALTVNLYPDFCTTNGDDCNVCSTTLLNWAAAQSMDVQTTYDWVTAGIDKNFFARSSNLQYARLSCYGDDERWFYVMESHGDFGHFLDVVSIIAIVFYFVTSSDSGSYIIDTLGSNGDLNPPKLQRLFWALTEGGAATALLLAGGRDALNALRTVSIVCGLPYTVVICFVCVALWRACQVSFYELDPKAPDFQVGYFDFASEFKLDIIVEWFLGFILGPYWAAKAAVKAWEMKPWTAYIFAGFTYFLLFVFVLFHFLNLAVEQFWALAWTMYFAFATLVGAMRTAVRSKQGYIGNPVEDFFAALFCYPSVGQQLKHADEDVVVNQNGHMNGNMPPPTYDNVKGY